MTERVVHVLRHGATLCGMTGPASEWPPGHQWVAKTDEMLNDLSNVTCNACCDAAQTALAPRTVTVCDSCLRASCWQGKHYCEDYKSAGTVEKTVKELRDLKLEHPSYWTREANDGEV